MKDEKKNMEIKQIKEIIAVFEETSLTEMEIEIDGLRLAMTKEGKGIATQNVVVATNPTVSTAPSPIVPVQENKTWVKAPLVGTVYLSKSPESEPFVKVGQQVKKGDVLCIVEAMKVMNEITASCNGVISEISVENGQLCQYDQNLIGLDEA